MIQELSAGQWGVLGFGALMIGLSKTGLPGAAIVAIPLLANVFSAKASTGLVLPMLIAADLIAVIYYRRKADWSHLIHLIPWAATGVVIGYGLMLRISDAHLMPVIGVVVLAMLLINGWRRRASASAEEAIIPETRLMAAAFGLMAGIVTMMANAAGPVMAVYFLAMRLPKECFVGTGAWYFFLLNLFKVPFSMRLGLINPESLALNMLILPVVIVGALAGIVLLRHIPQRKFAATVEILAALAAVKLLLP